MNISTKRLTMRGRSKEGAASYALPLSKEDLEIFGIAGHPRDYQLVVKSYADRIVVTKLNDQERK